MAVKSLHEMMTRCPKCGHIWLIRVVRPKACPSCKFRLRKIKKGV